MGGGGGGGGGLHSESNPQTLNPSKISLHGIQPHQRKMEQRTEIIIGTCPTMIKDLATVTAKGS